MMCLANVIHHEQRLQNLIVALLRTMKLAFKDEKDNFKYHKFHTIVHAPLQVRTFGNLRIMDGNRKFGLFFIIFITLYYILFSTGGSKLMLFWPSMFTP